MHAMQGFRLSPQQRHMWNAASDGVVPCGQCALLVEGECDVARLRDLIERITARHEILRTTLYQQPGLDMPVQVIEDTASVSWQEIDLQPLDPRQAEETVERELARQRRDRSARAGAGPDILLIYLERRKLIVSLALPAISSDTATLAMLAHAIGFHLAGQPITGGEEDTIPYLQFSEWQNNLPDDDEYEQGVEYWQSLYAREAPPLKLPFLTSGTGAAAEPARVALSLSGPSLDALDAAAVAQGISVHALLLACWQTLLWRLTGEAVIRSGYVCDGRNFPGLEAVLGPCAITVPIQGDLARGLLFHDVARRADGRINEALNWQEYFPGSDVAKDVAGQVWPVVFQYAPWTMPPASIGPRVALHSYTADAERFVLKLRCSRETEKLSVELLYAPRG